MKVILILVAYILIVTTNITLANKFCGSTAGACNGRLGNATVPWQADLILTYKSPSGKEYKYHCEAVLVSQHHIMSTSRCVSHYPGVTSSVRLGGKAGKEYKVQKWYIEGGNEWDFHERLAIGVLNVEVKLIPHLVEPVCLPHMSEWGDGTPNNQSAILEYLSKYRNECSEAKKEFDREPLYSEMCVKTKKGRVCKKDIGAPIVYKGWSKRCYLVGILSDATDNCHASVNYAISIPDSRNWIDQILHKN
nr:uncharacterized protein LOC121121524 isoform X2 [Lepeophtheirus salmonis]XP_040573087.1 uncharacterized protein LOC121122147 isoform X2 [Lepeophtheirus salmonis]